MEKFEKIRKEYPGLEHQAYLDTSTTGLISKKSYEAMRKYLDQRHFTGVTLSEYWGNWTYADKVRESLAKMINADEKEVFYGKDCSDMINVFVSKVDIPAKANVVIPDISFPSTRNSWLNRVSDGLEVRYVKNNNGIVTTKQIIEAMDEQTLAVSVCSVEPSSGLKVKQNSRVKARLFSIVEKQKKLKFTSSLLEILCSITRTIDLDDGRIMHHTIQYG